MRPTFDPFRELFQGYSAHYGRLEPRGREGLPEELKRIERDRLPHWVDEIP